MEAQSQPAKLQNITAEWPGPVSGIMREGDMNIYCCNAHKKQILQVDGEGPFTFLSDWRLR